MMFCFLFSLPTVLISQGVFGCTLYLFLRLRQLFLFPLWASSSAQTLPHCPCFAVDDLYLVSFPPVSGTDGLLVHIYKGHPGAEFKQLAYLWRIQ